MYFKNITKQNYIRVESESCNQYECVSQWDGMTPKKAYQLNLNTGSELYTTDTKVIKLIYKQVSLEQMDKWLEINVNKRLDYILL